MKGKRYNEEQIIATLNQHEAGVSVESIFRDMGIAGDVLALEIQVWRHGRLGC